MAAAGRGPALPVAVPPAAIPAAAVAAALVGGLVIAARAPLGVAFVLALLYVPFALINFPAALAAWVPLVFVTRIGIAGAAPTAALAVLGMAWLGMLGLRRRPGELAALLAGRRPALLAAALLLVWVTLSVSWATDPGQAAGGLWFWWSAGLTLLLVATGLNAPAQVRLVAAAFVVGAVVDIAIGFADPAASRTALEAASDSEGARITGGSADPNYLAAGVVPALVLITGLVRRGRPLANLLLGAAAVFLIVGFAASQSRGGLVAAALALLAALVVYRGRRPHLIVFAAFLASVAAIWFSVNPGAWERVVTFDKGGFGRTELWQIGLRMTEDHPIVGVGTENFVVESRHYVRRPGTLEFVPLVIERAFVAHNAYVQTMAETGLIGLVLLLALLLACMRAALLAARAFEARGDPESGALARAALVAIAASAASSFFISNGTDRRVWILLALGPALLGAARARARPPGAAEAKRRMPAYHSG